MEEPFRKCTERTEKKIEPAQNGMQQAQNELWPNFKDHDSSENRLTRHMTWFTTSNRTAKITNHTAWFLFPQRIPEKEFRTETVQN